ncbi:hypothetical protein EDB86DRAFT_2891724 [Lactarius hatsudake]|nr:hypothetical protein EDB86DRAFT_2891724 [Lactarius hatsudake]
MASILKAFLKILYKLLCQLRFTKKFIPRCIKSWAPFLAFLASRLGIWRSWNNGTGARLDVRDHAIACSNIPASARHPSAIVATQLTANPQNDSDHPQAYPSVLDAAIHSNRASFNTHSHAVGRLSLTQSRDPKADHRQFGSGPSTGHLEVSPHPHASPSPTGVPGHRRGQPSASVAVRIENPSTESLHRSHVVNSPPLPEESSQSILTATPSISDFDLPPGRFLQLIVSEQIPRYTKNVTVQRKHYDIGPLTTIFPHVPKQIGSRQGSREVDCAPWIPATHPDGALYFYDKERRLFTDTDMHNFELKEEMEAFYQYLQWIIRHEELIIPSNNYDLVLDIMPTEFGQIQWSYYYACHETRCIFWLDVYDANHMISEVFYVTSPAHVSLILNLHIDVLLRTHWSLFPAVFNGRCLQAAVYDELVGILSHGCMDVMTAKASTLPYDSDTMQAMIKLVRKAKKTDAGVVYHTASVTRLFSYFAHWKFLYIHGQQHARVTRHQTVYSGVKQERSLLIMLLSPVLFLAPEVHLQDIKKLWTDEIIIETVWKSFMTKLVGEWEELILWSTVMLTANVGFLAIPGVVISNINNTEMTRASSLDIFVSPGQIASSISTLASIGSIVVGLFLVRHNRSKQKEDPAGASTYLYKYTHRVFGLEPMAIIFSLPWALLMWA